VLTRLNNLRQLHAGTEENQDNYQSQEARNMK
jgi:hypothetical protein